MKRVLLLILALFVSSVFAQSTAQITQYGAQSCLTTSTGVIGWFPDPQSACNASSVQYSGNTGWSHTATVTGTGPYTCTWTQTLASACSAGKTYTMGTQVVASALPCPVAGTVANKNFTLGYSNSPNDSSDVSGLTPPATGSSTCASGSGNTCGVTVGPISMVWSSLTPTAQGLYRISGDYSVTHTGAACTQAAAEKAASDSATNAATCPGAFGTVGGKPVCIPASTSSRNTIQAITGKSATAGNPPAGSDGGKGYSDRAPASGGNGNDGSAPSASDGKSLGTAGSGLPSGTGTTATNTASGTGVQKADLADIKTDCDKKPNSIGCGEYGTADTGPALPSSVAAVGSVVAASFASNASCPADMPFIVHGQTYAISFTPICNASTDYVRPVVLVLAAALAAFIFIGGLKA
jgi:hypothetical protein